MWGCREPRCERDPPSGVEVANCFSVDGADLCTFSYPITIKKFAHAAEYGILTALLFNALQIHIRRKPHALVVTALAATVFASSDEWHQTFVPGRDASLRDLGIDALGVVGVALWLALSEKKSEAFRTFI